MSQVKVVTDSLSDIPEAIARQLEISTVPALVQFGGRSFRDRVDLGAEEFYKRLISGPALPTTSQPPPSAFREVYLRLARETDRILSIHSASALTGIYGSAVVAACESPDLQIRVIDSEQVTMALGWLVILAARAARDGATMEDIRALLDDARPRAHIIAVLDTLEYAQRSGRLGKGSALIGTLLSVKPIISLVNGQVMPVENVRTHRRAMERLVEIVMATGPIQELAVMHAAGLESAMRVRDAFARTLHEEEILTVETGPVLGTHVGPKAVGVAWLNGKYLKESNASIR
jgi:DegV family protein with EDD domain